MSAALDSFSCKRTLTVGGTAYVYYSLPEAEKNGLAGVSRLPYSMKVLLENLLRNEDGRSVTKESIQAVAEWLTDKGAAGVEIAYRPARVLMQDFTGVPAVVDLAAMRDGVVALGGDPEKINPLVPVDLVIDHSVIVDEFGSPKALRHNVDLEYARNEERYKFLKWGQQAFRNFRVVPPGTGICHQVNLEYLGQVVWTNDENGETVAYPDTCVGTDSHTAMINGLGVLGWGVGGIEAEAAMLGQPMYMLMPRVVGFRLTGALREGVTATDLTLTVTQMLRKHGVVGKFVEFFGTGLSSMSLPDRATIANMAPEYGATMGFFPVDDETLRYLTRTNRPAETVELVEAYYKAQGLFRTDSTPDPEFESVIELDLATVQPSLAGPKRPQDRITLSDVRRVFAESLTAPVGPQGFGLDASRLDATAEAKGATMTHGSVAIAAITSCTNTSNPSVMVAAGLVAQKAVERGLTVPPYVKTSLAPGSRVVTAYLQEAGLQESLDALGFNLVGYGCTTCIGNSGPLDDAVAEAITSGDLIAAGVLSGNRNFEGRIHSLVKANFLASPPLVVAYALAGTVDLDLENDPLGTDSNGQPVYLRDVWPTQAEVTAAIERAVKPEQYAALYDGIEESNPRWNAIETSTGDVYEWDDASTYIQEPPFFLDVTPDVPAIAPITGARALAVLGDSVTTDHISPAGAIPKAEPAGQFLQAAGVAPADFNSFGSRRGNDRVMTRGTLANIRLRNALAPGTEGGWSTHLPSGETGYLYDVAMRYRDEGTPLVVVAGHDYGMGSSRDWAAKGTLLLGVKAVIAQSFERIHRSNLVGMGVLPLLFQDGETLATYGLDGTETFDIPVGEGVRPGERLAITATRADGSAVTFKAIAALNTPIEVEYYRHGGILNYVLRDFLRTQPVEA